MTREETKKRFQSWCQGYIGNNASDEDYQMFNNIMALLEQEPKTGHWRHYEGMLICSECGTEFYDDIMEYCGDDVPKCCPNCGAKMIEPQERSDKE